MAKYWYPIYIDLSAEWTPGDLNSDLLDMELQRLVQDRKKEEIANIMSFIEQLTDDDWAKLAAFKMPPTWRVVHVPNPLPDIR